MRSTFIVLLAFCTIARAQDRNDNLQVSTLIHAAARDMVLLNNSKGTLPVKDLPGLSIAAVRFHFDHHGPFDSLSNKYWKVTPFDADTIADLNALHDRLKLFNLVILELSGPPSTPLTGFIRDLGARTPLVIVLSGPGAALAALDYLNTPIIWYPDDNDAGAAVAA
ncbi:MAG TPA: beta-N-acetylglucosaminidase, partial [Verrucomicrobiae bacterium]|nr:beta-N-acetylglucosaminidase [Verrucomicrobiae bacterium]